ncbi:MAG: DUF721 domain-containing protein [Ignavibacteriaceae bacterium]|nr:DUF721 domain-containing protein [Ignavibacteriaceae bacterium]
MDKGFIKLSDIINNEPAFGGLRKRIKETEVIDGFFEIFPDLSKVVKPSRVDKKTLFLKVENSVWRSELKFSETRIIQKINEFFKEERIKHIKFS